MKRAIYSLLVALLLLAGLITVQRANTNLLRMRKEQGITQADPLVNAPPLVAFTTVALGGFRGMIADILWMRSTRLQSEGRFFELVQLADWITKLEPRFSEVWAFHAWNLAYNVSVLFPNEEDRWRWVRHGFSLLRDEGMLYNPDNPALINELAWIFQHKIGGHTDDAHRFYKYAWAKEMESILGDERPAYSAMTPALRNRLVREYKLDPEFMRNLEAEFGPLDWRLPQSHAIYWAAESRKIHGGAFESLFAKRILYQSMADAFRDGRLVRYMDTHAIETGPDFDLLPFCLATYERTMKEFSDVQGPRDSYLHFLAEAIITTYLHDRPGEASALLMRMRNEQPSIPENITVEEFIITVYQRRGNPEGNADPRQALIGAMYEEALARLSGQAIKAQANARLVDLIWTKSGLSGVEPESFRRQIAEEAEKRARARLGLR